jgi:sterol desaturase/sphingolipid hydroxylase (fatty acid hydroxylase superfamily)
MKKNVEDFLAFKNGEIKMPRHLKPQKKEYGGRLFKNDFMEKFTRTPIWIPQIMFIVLSVLVLRYGYINTNTPLITTFFIMFAGFISWSLAEYLVHRFLYHTETNSDTLTRIQHNGHSIHHLYPKDPTRLAMPPLPAIVLSSLFFGLFWLIMGKFSFFFWPGFMWGYLAYITFHFAQHRFRIPKYPPLRRLWKQHLVHHYKNPYVAYGVSTQLWDFVFGTMAKDDSGKMVK